MPTYEMAFLAIASKNNFLTHDEAAQTLAEFQQQPAGASGRKLDDLLLDKGLLTAEQVRLISQAARKIAAASDPAAPPGTTTRRIAVTPPGAGGSRPPTSRIPVPPSGAPPAAPPAKPAGPAEPIPGIRIVGKLGVGGTATVFLADDVKHGRKVALKIMHPSLAKDAKAVRRFQRESTLLCAFDHPNLVKGYAQGLMGPLSYLVMECLEGESAQEALEREKQFSEAKALEIILETAKGIDHMQAKGIIHRDIKPGNIFLLKDGRVKVIDLGFAQEIGAEGVAGEEETTSGTVQYMSPEQARGQLDLDVRADIYSLGATLYHMIMGETPFAGGDSLEVMAKQVMEALSSSGLKNRRISKHMHYFIERMMSKDKDLRYPTAHELVKDINEQIEGFKSLEYRPEPDARPASTVLRLATRPGRDPRATTRRLPLPPPTRRIVDPSKRFKKP